MVVCCSISRLTVVHTCVLTYNNSVFKPNPVLSGSFTVSLTTDVFTTVLNHRHCWYSVILSLLMSNILSLRGVGSHNTCTLYTAEPEATDRLITDV